MNRLSTLSGNAAIRSVAAHHSNKAGPSRSSTSFESMLEPALEARGVPGRLPDMRDIASQMRPGMEGAASSIVSENGGWDILETVASGAAGGCLVGGYAGGPPGCALGAAGGAIGGAAVGAVVAFFKAIWSAITGDDDEDDKKKDDKKNKQKTDGDSNKSQGEDSSQLNSIYQPPSEPDLLSCTAGANRVNENALNIDHDHNAVTRNMGRLS